LPTTKFNFPNIPSIDWEKFTDLRSARAISQTIGLFCQTGAGKQQTAASAALSASPFADRLLFKNIRFLKMSQPETPPFSASVI
jgi:hypothetical protein